MMKLSTIQAVGSTIREDDGSPIAEEILNRWGYDDGSVKIVRLSSNCIFTFEQQGKKRFLRFASDGEKHREHIEAEVQLLEGLAEAGLSVSRPILSKHGKLVETVETKSREFHAVVFTALAGPHLELEDLDVGQYRKWGAALGRLHAAMKKLSFALQRPSHLEQLAFIEEHLPQDEPLVQREWKELRTWIDTLPRDEEHYGLIHFDFELDNLCWESDTIHMLDFDDSMYHWYMADIAFASRDYLGDNVDVGDELFQSFLSGYQEYHSFDEAHLKYLPMFLRLRALHQYAELARSVDLAPEETAQWIAPLRKRLVDKMISYKQGLSGR